MEGKWTGQMMFNCLPNSECNHIYREELRARPIFFLLGLNLNSCLVSHSYPQEGDRVGFGD